MEASLRAFLANLIDYAGLFPPAKLELDPAIRNYAAYRESSDAWMLSRFIIPSKQLDQLASYHDELFAKAPADQPFRFSVLGRGGADAEAFLDGLREDCAAMAEFKEHHGQHVATDIMEVRIPADIADAQDPGRVGRFLDAVAAVIDEVGPDELTPYLEIPVAGNDNWRRMMERVIPAVAHHERHDSTEHPRYRAAGVKVRCGGVEAHMFPTPEQVAAAIAIARGAGVKLKCTAGLHHPVRHHNDSVSTKMHGFLNVFGAGILATVHDMSEHQLAEMIEDEDPGNFQFDDSGFSWKEFRAPADSVSAGRTFVTSYGSCSFDEPRDDLRQLELLR